MSFRVERVSGLLSMPASPGNEFVDTKVMGGRLTGKSSPRNGFCYSEMGSRGRARDARKQYNVKIVSRI